MKKILFSSLLFFSFQIYPQEGIWVWIPCQHWNTQPGEIEEEILTISPLGGYAQIELDLTLSAGSSQFYLDNPMELIYRFSLPENSIVNNLQMFADGDTIKGIIIDSLTAIELFGEFQDNSNYYDPAVLRKIRYLPVYGDSQKIIYELRIYPLKKEEKKKVRISVLVPVEWHKDQIFLSVPMPFTVDGSEWDQYSIKSFIINFFPGLYWENPFFNSPYGNYFVKVSDDELGEYYHADFSNIIIETDFAIQYDSPAGENIFMNYTNNFNDLSKTDSGDEGIYQLSVVPDGIIEFNTKQKLLIVLDHRYWYGPLSTHELLQTLKKNLILTTNETDSFNVIYFDGEIKRKRNYWIQATDENIEREFNNFYFNSDSDIYDLVLMIIDAVNFIKENGNEGKILTIADSGGYDTVMSLLLSEAILVEMTNKIPMCFVDYYNTDSDFYKLLADSTGGFVVSKNEGPVLNKMIYKALNMVNGPITDLQFSVVPIDGTSFDTVISKAFDQIFLSVPLIITGKYLGNHPFTLSLSGKYSNDIFSILKNIDPPPPIAADSLLFEIISGKKIIELEYEEYSPGLREQIVDLSISEGVLSFYTAWFILEKSDTTGPCFNCIGNYDFTDIESEIDFGDTKQLSIEAYPNPFNGQSNIRIILQPDSDKEIKTIFIFNSLGEKIKSFEVHEQNNKRFLNLVWNGKNDNDEPVGSGVYFLVLEYNYKVIPFKILLLK